MTFTKDRLEEIAEDGFLKHGESKELARIALAGMEVEPVAYVDPHAFQNFSVYRAGETDNKRMGRDWMWANPDAGLIPLYTAPQLLTTSERAELENYHHLSELYHAQEKRLFKLAQRIKGPAFDKYAHSTSQAIDVLESAVFGESEDASRAAMQPAHVPPGGKAVQPLTTEIMELVDRITGHRLSVAKMSELRPCIFEACRAAMQSGAVKDGWVMVPNRLTAENFAKAALSGEFYETKFINCHECFGDDECETCDGSGRIEIKVPVSWTNIKAIWEKGIEHFSAAPKQEAE